MTTWTVKPELRTVMYAPIGLKLFDDLTGQTPSPLRLVDRIVGAPRGDVAVTLLESIDSELRPTGLRPILTPSGILTFPGLGRTASPTTTVPRTYEIRIEADAYRPFYRTTGTGIGFTAFPYNDEVHPPADIPVGPVETRLIPSVGYRFPNHLPILRGVVTEGGQPVVDALVSATVTVGVDDLVELGLSDEAGQYVLPLRWLESGVATTVEAVSPPPLGSGRQGSISITLPDSLGTNQEIQLT